MFSLAAPAIAAQQAGPAVSGTEHFQILSTATTSGTAQVIVYGVVTAAGVDHMGNKVDKFVFPGGSFKVAHKNGKGGTHHFTPRTCLTQVTQPGTYTIFGGTGKYAGISGHGKFLFTLLVIGAKNSGGSCVQTKPPVAAQQVVRASGPVTT
jgi:hypothetical protein